MIKDFETLIIFKFVETFTPNSLKVSKVIWIYGQETISFFNVSSNPFSKVGAINNKAEINWLLTLPSISILPPCNCLPEIFNGG